MECTTNCVEGRWSVLLTEGRVGGVVTVQLVSSICTICPAVTQPLLLQTLPTAAGKLAGATRP